MFWILICPIHTTLFPICIKSLQYHVQCKALHHLSTALAHHIRKIRAHAEHKQIWQHDAADELYHAESRNSDLIPIQTCLRVKVKLSKDNILNLVFCRVRAFPPCGRSKRGAQENDPTCI